MTSGLFMKRDPARHTLTLAIVAGLVFSFGALRGAHAQIVHEAPHGEEPVDAPPNVDEGVLRLLEAPYLTPAEGARLRIFHGVWRPGDLDSPQSLARAALLVGVPQDPSFVLESVAPEDRAEAALQCGETDLALRLTDGLDGVRGRRLRMQALEYSGRFEEAIAVGAEVEDALARGVVKDAEGITESVRCMMLLTRLRGPARVQDAAGDYHAMMAALDSVRGGIDRHYWPAVLVQAQLLYDKDNPAEAEKAAREALSLNPRCAEAWALLGHMAAQTYNFEAAEQIAAKLDTLAEQVSAVSMAAAQVRIRAALKLRDPDEAARLAEETLRILPRHRGMLALLAAAEATRFDVGATRAALERLEAISPGTPDGVFEVGCALSDARQYEEAASMFDTATARCPAWPAPLIELGLLEIQAGREDRALAALDQAGRLDPFNIRAANSLKLVREIMSYSRTESDHFVVRHRAGPDAVLAAEMLPTLEAIHTTVCGRGDGGIDHEPDRKTFIDLMPDHQWFGVRIAGLPKIHTIAASTGPAIAMEAPRDGAGHFGTYDWPRVLQHEYTHTVTLSRTRNRIPHWFTEAAAVYLEQSPRDFATCQLLAGAFVTDSLFDLTQINVAFIRPKRPSDRQQAYAQGHWMYEFIISRFGREAPLEFMDAYAQGVLEESAFEAVLGMSRARFLAEFKGWAGGQLVSWGLLPPNGQKDVRTLMLEQALRDTEFSKGALERLSAAVSGAARAGAAGEADPDAEAWSINPPALTHDMLISLVEANPNHPDLLELLIKSHLADAPDGKATEDMIPLLDRYAEARPVDPMPHRLLAGLALSAGRSAGAIRHLEWLDAREQNLPTYAIEQARQYSALGDWDRARAAAERATRMAPYNGGFRELAAGLAVKIGDLDAGERHIRALIALEPDRAVHQERLEALIKRREPTAPRP